MRLLVILFLSVISFFSCNSKKTTIKNHAATTTNTAKNDTIHIANKELDYEILIIEIGFDNWLITQPPKGFYGLTFLESKNRRFVTEYNNNVFKDKTRTLYEQEINYNPDINYGLEVNYLLYNYFIYFQQKYQQKL